MAASKDADGDGKNDKKQRNRCVNCGKDAVVQTDGRSANPVWFCARCRPPNV